MDDYILISLILLSFFIGLFFSWLVTKTLKEGKEAQKEIRRDTK